MSTRDIDVIKQTILQNKIVSSDTISQFMEKCNNNFSAIIEFGGGPVGEKGEKGEDGVPTKPKVPIHVWKERVDYEYEEPSDNNEYEIINPFVELDDPKYKDGHLIILENAHVYILELDNTNFQLKPKFLTIFNTYNPYNNLEKNKAYVHIAYADEYYDNDSSDEATDIGFITSDKLKENENPLNKKYIGVYTDDIFESSQEPYAYKWSKIKGDTGERGERGERGDIGAPMFDVDYTSLLQMSKNNTLTPGVQYRITDYITICNNNGTKYSTVITSSANHQFDIIVTADTINTLNADARVCLHEFEDSEYEDSEYFLNNKLSEWKIKYDINNDTNKYKWAAKNGKGVIYWMQDEFGNEACYDFKNIIFKQPYLSNNVIFNKDDFYYTFTYIDNNSKITDYSLLNKCNNNIIKKHTDNNNFNIQYINKILINCDSLYPKCENNTFDINCDDILIGGQSFGNTFGMGCENINIGYSNAYNTFKNYCLNINLSSGCENNIFDTNVENITLSTSCSHNTFGTQSGKYGPIEFNKFSSRNKIGSFCYNISLGNNCNNNNIANGVNKLTLTSKCENNIFGYKCSNIILGNNCNFNIFGNKCEYINFLHDNYVGDISYIHMSDGVIGNVNKYIPTKEEAMNLMNVIKSRNYISTINILLNSDQQLVYYCEADFAKDLGQPLLPKQ